MEKVEIKKGIKVHKIQTDKFKTNLIAAFLSLPLTRQTATKNALIATVLRRGSKNLTTQEQISKKLEEMYGATFNCGIEKTGDIHTMKFYLEIISDEYLPKGEENLKQAIEILLDIIFNPLTEEDSFKEEYVQSEKENLKQIIEGKIDNKGSYALERCIEEIYKDKPYGVYKYGYIEELEKITAKELYTYYKEMIEKSKIDIFSSGVLPENTVEIIKQNENIQKLQERQWKEVKQEEKTKIQEPKLVNESMQISQGKLVIGLDILEQKEDISYVAMVYNTILGGGANSKMFQNVREKESLAYTAGSNYIKKKQNIFVRAGIEIENYQKAVDIIKIQLKDMEEGNFNEEDIQNAKNLIQATIDSIEEEQDTEITYYLGQEMSNSTITIPEYKQKIEGVTKQQIVELAKQIQINTIYFLKD